MSEVRLIDANQFEAYAHTIPPKYDADSFMAGMRAVLEAIDEAPTIDAAEVVRCRDCIYAKPIPAARRRDYFDPDGLRHCALMRTEADVYGVCALREDCYCDEGERKEPADDL